MTKTHNMAHVFLWTLIFILLSPETVQAAGRQSGVDAFAPTFHIDITAGFSTAKSELVTSNDTSTGTSYRIGGNAGEEHEFGFYVNTDSQATTFELNSSATAATWQDTCLRYRMSYVYLGLVFSLIEMTANDEGTDLLEAGGSGQGGNFGILIPLGRTSVLYLDVVSVTMSQSRNSLTEEVSFGSRQDVDIGASVDISRQNFDFLMGFRQRTFTLTVTESATETLYTTYLGMRLATFF